MVKVGILITSHNRKSITINCLESISLQNLSADIFLVDDGSTDGTEVAVRTNFPDVKIIKGDGNLFWNRGMHLAWTVAMDNDYDYYLWLNDDTLLKSGAIQAMVDLAIDHGNQVVICGATQDKHSLEFTYGGRDQKYLPLIPSGKVEEVYYMNGNVVLVPKYVFEKVGILDPFFHHDIGDFDYGLRARKKGVKILTTLDYVGFCERNVSALTRDRLMGVSLRKRMAKLFSPLGHHPVKQFRFILRHESLLNAIWVFSKLIFINIIPDQFYISYFNLSSVKSR